MRAMAVEFLPPPRMALWWWGLPALLLTAALVLAYRDWRDWRSLQVAKASMAAMQRELEALDAAAFSRAGNVPPAPPAYAADAARVVAIAIFPLQAVLVALETVAVQGVSLVSVEVDADQAKARIEVEFEAYANLLGYLEQLNAGDPARWSLVQARAAGSGGGASVATLESHWLSK